MSDTSTSLNNQPSKTTGQYHSLKGTAVEAVGDLTGATSWQQSGRQEHLAGEAEIQAAQAKDYIEGTLDHAQGKLDSIIGAVTGDRSREVHGNLQQDSGKAREELNKPQ